MGGFGSTRWGVHHRKLTTEECLILDIRQLLHQFRRLPQDRLGGTITWANRDQPDVPSACTFILDIADPCDAWLELKYHAGEQAIVCRVALLHMPSFGGAPW
jgi:hypothetical protein